MLVPVIGLVQAGEQAMADRYTYMPLIGLFVALTWGIAEVAKRYGSARKFLMPSVALLFGVYAMVANIQVRYWKGSKTLFTHALRATMDNAIARFGLAKALSDEGKMEQAVGQLRRALALQPGFAKARAQLAYILCEQQNFEEGIQQYILTLQTAPDVAEALNNLAWIRATHPNPAFRNGPEAVRLAERACAVTHNQKTLFMGTLAAAYAEAGRFNDAIAEAEKARDHAIVWKETQLAERNQELIQLYKAGKPYRQQ